MLLVALLTSGVWLMQPPAKDSRACTRLEEVASDTTFYIVPRAQSPLRPRKGPGPQYPTALRDHRVQGEVIMTFVVDTLGRVVPESAGIIEQAHPDFGRSVCEYLRRATFEPFAAAGKRMSVRVVGQKFLFSTRG